MNVERVAVVLAVVYVVAIVVPVVVSCCLLALDDWRARRRRGDRFPTHVTLDVELDERRRGRDA